MKNIGLVLEGGGLRGLYTAAILDFFMEKNLYFPYVIGTSAGASNGVSYVSKQIGRSKKINLDYINDKRYFNLLNILRGKPVFGLDFIFYDIPDKYVPFDFREFYENEIQFTAVSSDVNEGVPRYFNKYQIKENMECLKASVSLPFLSDIVKVFGYELLDGGICDSIPLKRSIEDKNEKNVVILTRNDGYIKKPKKLKNYEKKKLTQYPKFVKALEDRHLMYSSQQKLIESKEKEGKAFVFRPSKPLKVDTLTKNRKKLSDLYDLGYQDAKDNYENLIKFLEK